MDRPTVDLFVEDRAHEEFLKALVERLSIEEGRSVVLRIRSAQGGHGRVLEEFKLYQRLVECEPLRFPSVLVVAVDANCRSYHETQQDLRSLVQPAFQDRVAFACPEPHVERWFMADPESFAAVVGAEPPRGPKKCERNRYKRQLVEVIRRAGHVPTLGGIEFAKDLALAMDLYRAGKNESSLKAFLDGARAMIRLIPKT